MGISLEGTWKVILTDGTAAQMHLPGTLDESGIGHTETSERINGTQMRRWVTLRFCRTGAGAYRRTDPHHRGE